MLTCIPRGLYLFSCSVRQLKASVNQLEVKLHVFYTLPESKTEIQKTLIHMKKRFLRLKTAMRAVMLILIMGVVGITEGFAYNFSAECETGQTLYYDITDNENHYVTVVSPTLGYYNLNGEMTIPDVVTNVNDGISYQVTSIGEYAFYECTGLTSVEIPNSVTSIGDNAFAKCTGLKSVEIPNSVTSIGLCAFDGCKGLKSVEIPNSVTSIGEYAFRGCTGLKSLTIGNLVESIGGFAFYHCSSVTSLTIPNSVKSIGDGAFAGCTGLTEITSFANSAPQIENTTFWGLNNITLTVPYGSIDKYKEAPGWNNFTKYQPMAYTEITGYGSSNDSDHWVFIASPLATSVQPTVVEGLVADPVENYDLYRFNQSGNNNDGEWENYKNKVLKANDTATVVTGRRLGHPVRSIKNPFSRDYQKVEYTDISDEELENKAAGALRKAVVDGDEKNGCFLSGQIAGLVTKEESCEDIIKDLMSDTERILEDLTKWVK